MTDECLPLEQTDPVLADHILRIVNGTHCVAGFEVKGLTRTYQVKHGGLILSVVRCSKPPGRNDPCFCGSKKKYKKCCGR